MELKDRLLALLRALPPAQRLGLAVGVAVLAMAAVPFVMWVTSPSYALLFGGMDDAELAGVIEELDARGIPYRLEGSRVLVPQPQLHEARAQLAQAGVSSVPTVPGYELLDEQALGTSDLRQRVDLQRALEGELARTLNAMDGVETATVRLVLPEDQLFTDNQSPATASVLVRPRGTLGDGQIEAITLLVSSAVEGLETDQVTVADTQGNVLHAPGDGTTGGVTDRQQRRTQDFERSVAAELTQLIQRATGSAASVVVRADLDYDEVETQTETFAPDSAVALRESTTDEAYEGAQAPQGGLVGVDGGPLPGMGGDGTYERSDATREFGVDRTTTRTVRAPGQVEGLSVAVVVDQGAAVTDNQLRELVGAAAGLDEERGDTFAITRIAMPLVEDVAEEAGPSWIDMVQWGVALLVLLLVAVGLFLMSRRRRPAEPERVVPAAVRPVAPAPAALDPDPTEALPTGPTLQDEVAQLVERQPEEIAMLLRGWLADRRTGVR